MNFPTARIIHNEQRDALHFLDVNLSYFSNKREILTLNSLQI